MIRAVAKPSWKSKERDCKMKLKVKIAELIYRVTPLMPICGAWLRTEKAHKRLSKVLTYAKGLDQSWSRAFWSMVAQSM